ncbi:hypothetical protein C0Z18_04565 [Trinickia dabaoshanensis]|uniref:Uncharacterized protein n=1 Tax=Trinickia dabaoshanensis TaxID=564714 RepID=A0A2N7VZN6_9BURK|nr:hypothetical protein [Trinickia dabaoshanensis]PMS22595.1 hypothetical protein C0Z18_04565 [Trinickia dabaoshanensis]
MISPFLAGRARRTCRNFLQWSTPDIDEGAAIEFETVAPAGGGAVSLFKRVDELLGLVKDKGANDGKRFADMTQAVEALAGFAKNLAARVDEYAGKLDTASADLATEKNAHAARLGYVGRM